MTPQLLLLALQIAATLGACWWLLWHLPRTAGPRAIRRAWATAELTPEDNPHPSDTLAAEVWELQRLWCVLIATVLPDRRSETQP